MKLLKLASHTMIWFLLAALLLLLSCQSRLIYYPRPYGEAALQDLEQRKGRCLEFSTSQGRQTAFYLPPRGHPEDSPAFLWLVFGGNGSLALDYDGEPLHWDARFGYLFVDYPGYGLCEGKPSPQSIRESALASAESLRVELGWSEPEFRERAGVFGHSLGCAAALILADALQLRRAVLCAPFTTMTEMGRTVLGWPLCHLNMHRFNNVARLKALDERGVKVRIFHGTADEIIPIAMSRSLAERFPKSVRLTELPGTHHNEVLMDAGRQIGAAMQELCGME